MTWAEALYRIFDDIVTGLVILGVALAFFTDFWDNFFLYTRRADEEKHSKSDEAGVSK